MQVKAACMCCSTLAWLLGFERCLRYLNSLAHQHETVKSTDGQEHIMLIESQVLTCATSSSTSKGPNMCVKRAETPAAAATSSKKAKATPAEHEDPLESSSKGNNDHSIDAAPERSAGSRASWQHATAEEERDSYSSQSEGDSD